MFSQITLHVSIGEENGTQSPFPEKNPCPH